MAFDYDGTHDLETSLQDSFGEAILHGVGIICGQRDGTFRRTVP